MWWGGATPVRGCCPRNFCIFQNSIGAPTEDLEGLLTPLKIIHEACKQACKEESKQASKLASKLAYVGEAAERVVVSITSVQGHEP
jgi:hypothetical protein